MKQLFCEPFGSSRRNRLVKECIKYINKGKKVFYILPSREAMFQVRKLFTEGQGGIFGCQVLGFDDLEKLLLGDSQDRSKVIGDFEERILLSYVLKELPEGTAFDRVKDKPGFLELLLQTIRGLKRSNIFPDEFLSKTAGIHGATHSKCAGLYSIYSGYEKIKVEKGLEDIDDISLRAVEASSNTKHLGNTGVIVIDGFINIDPVNIKLLKNICESHPGIDLYANVPFMNKHNEQFLFSEIIKDMELLGFERLESDTELIIEFNPSLHTVSQHIYSGEGDIKPEAGCLAIQNSPCLDHEIRSVARKIKMLILEDSIKPSDIALVTADIEGYKAKVYEIFKESGVPLNMKSQEILVSIPVVKDLLALWRLGLEEEKYNAFLSITTSKYLLPEEVLLNEGFETNGLYSLAEKAAENKDISSCFSGFLKVYAGTTENEFLKGAMEQYINRICAFLDILQKKPSEALISFKDLIQLLDVDTNISLLYREGILKEELWLRDLGAINELLRFVDRMLNAYESYGLDNSSKETQGMVKELFAVLSSLKTADTGRDSGGVRFMPPDLARGQTYDTVFVMGINEGLFPSAGNGGSVFDTYEAREFFYRGINLGSPEWELEREKLRFNACISSARKRLYLSFRTADENGGVMIASPFIDEVVSVLNKEIRSSVVAKPVSMRERMNYNETPFSLTEAVKRVGSSFRGSNKINSQDIYKGITDRLKYPRFAAGIEFSREQGSEFDAYDGKLMNPVLAQQDVGYGFSASQLNSYSRCPFTYFAQRVLVLGVEEDDSLKDVLDIGTFYHAVLKDYHQGNENPCRPNLEKLNTIFKDMTGQLTLKTVQDPVRKFIMEGILLTLQNFVIFDAENMSRYHEVTGFNLQPVMLEQPFELTVGKEKNKLKGIIDRIDLEISPMGSYTGRFLLYDYKKGRVKGIKECIEGTDHQLPLYHGAVSCMLKEKYNIAEPECLALLYYSIEKLEWNGIIRRDTKKALFEGRKGTKSTPVKENMEVVLSWAEEQACTVMNNIRSGYFMPPKECPASDNFGCPYSSMCRYDRARLALKVGAKQ